MSYSKKQSRYVEASITRERLLDAVPAVLVILAVLICMIGAVFFPHVLTVFSALLAFYAMLRFVFIGMASFNGLRRIAAYEKIDWYQRYKQHPSQIPWQDIQHIIIIPNYNEPLAVLRKSLDNLAKSQETHHMTIVLAMEAVEAEAEPKAERLIAEYAHHFSHMCYTLHPAGLPGEAQCKSANQNWAIRRVLEKFDYDRDYVVITTMDADTLWHPAYFSALTYHFGKNPARYRTFWQAPIRYHGNIYEIDPMLRDINVYTTATELGYLEAAWWQSLPISSYSLSLRLLEQAGYWDKDVIADEWRMYSKAFFATWGNLNLEPIYLPFLATAVTGDTLCDTFRKRYTQTLRHAWGSKEIGYAIGKMLDHPEVDFWRSLRLINSIWHDLFLSSAGWIFLTAGAQLPLLLHPSLRVQVLNGYPPFVVMQFVTLVMALLGLSFLVLDIRSRPPRQLPPTRSERIRSIVGLLLLPVFGLLFIIFPVFHAQFQLMFGKKLTFVVTPKR